MKTIAIIPARGGSKGYQKKSSHAGSPSVGSVANTFRKKNPGIEAIYLSTDDPEIAAKGSEYDVTILDRPKQLAEDESRVVDMITYHLNEFKAAEILPEIIVYLEPTSPFRTTDEISDCINLIFEKNLDSVATFARSFEHPAHHRHIAKNGALEKTKWSGDIKYEDPYFLTGAAYVFRVTSFIKLKPSGIFFGNKGYIIQRSPAIDIDTPTDLENARYIAHYYRSNHSQG